MKALSKVKTGVKLLASFLFVAIIAGAIGIVGIININEVEKNGALLYQLNTRGVIKASEASEMYQRARYYAIKMTITEGVVQNQCLAITQDSMDSMDAVLAEYEQSITTPEDRAVYQTTYSIWSEYKDHLKTAVDTVNADKSRAALVYLLTKTEDTSAALQESFGELFELNARNAAARSEQNYIVAQRSTYSMIVFAAVGLLAAVLLGLIITRSITKPVKSAAAQLSKMAAGAAIDELNIERFSGEFKQIAQNINDVRSSLNMLLRDIGLLTEAAVQGQLSARADASAHQGGYRKMIEGINNTLDAVTEPINEATSVLEEMSKGNLDVSVAGDYKGDHAVIKNALNNTINAINGYISEIAHVLGEMSGGNLDMEITSEYLGDFVALKEAINGIVASLNNVMSEINTAANQVSSGTSQVSDGSQEIAQGAAEQASSIEQLTAAVTQIAEQTRQNAMSADQASEVSTAAKDNAVAGNEQMKMLQQAMEEINESSTNISKIIKVIDDIAFQTNILALNAAVEAARAGVHGKGFAVVAEEVRNLAARSAGAAKETTDMIEGSIKKTQAGTKIADGTAQALDRIVEGVQSAVTLVAEIASASNQQASGIREVNKGIEQMSQVVQTNSATSEEAAAASEELSSQAELLKSMVGQFRLKQNQADSEPEIDMPEASTEDAETTPEIVLDQDYGKY